VTDEVQPYVASLAHPLEDPAELDDGRAGDLGDARLEADRRHEIRELDGRQPLGRDFAHLDAIAGLRVDGRRVVHPRRRLDLARQMALDGLAPRRLAEQLRVGACAEQRGREHDGRPAMQERGHEPQRLHSRFPLRRSRAPVGSPRRQKMSGSMASS
jgi:hypothetical protein